MKDYSNWDSLWLRAPNPTCLKNFDSNAFYRLDVCFWSPGLKWAHKGVLTPCPRHGWKHAKDVRLQERWRERLVKDLENDFCLAGQDAICCACRKDNNAAKKELSRARDGDASAEVIKGIKEKIKSTTFRFITTNPDVTACYAAKFPWVAHQMPAVLTHRAAMSTAVHTMIARSAVKGIGSHDLEAMFQEFRCIEQSRKELIFYGLQIWEQQRIRLDRTEEEQRLHKSHSITHHFVRGVSVISDTYITAAIKVFYRTVEPYIFQFFDQKVGWGEKDVAMCDHNQKRAWCLRYQGSRMFNYVFKALNG
jgi:hypothetical protein